MKSETYPTIKSKLLRYEHDVVTVYVGYISQFVFMLVVYSYEYPYRLCSLHEVQSISLSNMTFNAFIYISNSLSFFSFIVPNFVFSFNYFRYMAKILPKRRKTQDNQSIFILTNSSFLLFFYLTEKFSIGTKNPYKQTNKQTNKPFSFLNVL